MRVGFFTYGMDDRMTGIGRYAVQLTRALRALDPSLDIVLINPYPDSKHPWYGEFETYPVPSLRLLPAAASLGNVVLHQAALRLGLDILHDPCGIAPFLVPTTRYKRVTTIHDAVPFLYPRTQPVLTRAVFETLVRLARFTADGVLTVSNSAAEDLKRLLRLRPERLFVTPLGITPPEEAAHTEGGQEVLTRLGVRRPYFLHVGALHPRKNLGRLIEAFSTFQRQGGTAELVIVGPPSWGAHDTFKHVVANATGETGIVFTGFVDDAELHALYGCARALVFPSLYEGFGLPALEAMAHGTPVIASNTGSLPEVVGDAGVLVNPLSVGALVEGMRNLAQDDTLSRRLGDRGLERAKGFTWESTARGTLAAYRGILGDR